MNKDEMKLEEAVQILKSMQSYMEDDENELEAIETVLQELENKEKIINEMAEYLAIIRDCPNEDKGANLDCENRCSNDDSIYAECWKIYFERKIKEK